MSPGNPETHNGSLIQIATNVGQPWATRSEEHGITRGQGGNQPTLS